MYYSSYFLHIVMSLKDGFEKLDLTFNQMSEYFRDLCFPCFIDIAN